MNSITTQPTVYSWTDRFGLTRNPFKDTLDTTLFFRTLQHEEALVKIQIGIEDRQPIILLTGAAGTGKTMLSQVVTRLLNQAVFEPAFVLVHPGMTKAGLAAHGNVSDVFDEHHVGRAADAKRRAQE